MSAGKIVESGEGKLVTIGSLAKQESDASGVRLIGGSEPNDVEHRELVLICLVRAVHEEHGGKAVQERTGLPDGVDQARVVAGRSRRACAGRQECGVW